MGILDKFTNNKEQTLQIELDSVNILLTQKEQEVKKLKSQLEQLKDESQEKTELTIRLETEIEHLNKLVNEKQQIEIELNSLKKEKIGLLARIENLLNKIKKEKEIKDKYRYYFEHGAMDFSKAIAFFNNMTNNNLSEAKVRKFLVQNNILYKAGRYYAPTPYAKDLNYIVVYGENGMTAPKYTIEFLLYLKQIVDDEQL